MVKGAAPVASANAQNIVHYLVTAVPSADAFESAGVVRDRVAATTFSDASNIFVLRDGKLAGVVEIGELLGADASCPVADLMMPNRCPVVTARTDRERAASVAIGSGGSVLAVCDDEGMFLGAVPTGSLMAILRDEHIEDLHHMAGILASSEAAKTALAASPLRQASFRLPWLLVGMAGSALATAMMARFEAAIAAHIAVAFFVPGIVYLADAIGTQSEVVMVRALSLTDGKLLRMLVKEFATSVLIGGALGTIAFALVWLTFGNVALSATVALAVLLAGVIATMVGIVLPWGFAKIGYDPALASGPIATVLQDMLSLTCYFAIASMLIF
jgi:magnesium transporter